MVETTNIPDRELSESIKLIKNSRGYGWEIRILNLDTAKLEELNNDLIRRFGDSGSE